MEEKLNKVWKVLDGRKTYTGIIILIVGLFELTDYVTPDQITDIVDGICDCVGAILTVVGIIHKIIKNRS